ncbi:MAG: hypothetical protein HY332_01840 [Chloroflexi bacterium]|nr:hypothetical protein [Chloroflexota bacterium]
MDPMAANGWTIRTHVDAVGRTLYSLYIGDQLVVEAVPSPDEAVRAARYLVMKAQSERRLTKGAA